MRARKGCTEFGNAFDNELKPQQRCTFSSINAVSVRQTLDDDFQLYGLTSPINLLYALIQAGCETIGRESGMNAMLSEFHAFSSRILLLFLSRHTLCALLSTFPFVLWSSRSSLDVQVMVFFSPFCPYSSLSGLLFRFSLLFTYWISRERDSSFLQLISAAELREQRSGCGDRMYRIVRF